jgi:peroxiredoxin
LLLFENLLLEYYKMAMEQLTRIRGAFEVFKDGDAPAVNEQLVVVTRNGMLQRGDKLPALIGTIDDPDTQGTKPIVLNQIRGVRILSFVNEFGTPDCETHTDAIEEQAKLLAPDVKVFSLSKQDPAKLKEIAADKGISHALVSVDQETAINMGIALEPDKDDEGNDLADGFWNIALCRTVMVINKDNVITHIQQQMDQAQQPNIEALVIEARNAL